MSVTNIKDHHRKEILLCVDCANYRYNGAGLWICLTPIRKSKWNPVTGWERIMVDPTSARNNESDCGMIGRYYDPLPIKEAEVYKYSRWQKFLKRLIG